MPDKLKIFALGGLSIEFSGQWVALASRKARALVGYLALSPNTTATREHLVGLLWSEFEEDKARASLRQVLRILRTAFADVGFEGLTAGRNDISLEQHELVSDVTSALDSLSQACVSTSLLDRTRIADSLLGGFEDIDPSFRNWLLVQRESLSQKLTRGLEALMDNEGVREDGTDKTAAQALVLLDPTHERACRHLIRHHAEAGDMSAALGVYNRLWKILDCEYDAEPSEATLELIAAVKLGKIGPQHDEAVDWAVRDENAARAEAHSPLEELDRLALLVGQFDYDGIRQEQRHVCVGFRSELVSTLVRFRVWSIVDISLSEMPKARNERRQAAYLLHGQFYQDQENVYLVLESVRKVHA